MPDLADSSFDFVLDKGTLDALMCGSKASKDVTNTLKEIYRLPHFFLSQCYIQVCGINANPLAPCYA